MKPRHALFVTLLGSMSACVCSKTPPPGDDASSITTTGTKAQGSGFSAPIAAMHLENGVVIVAGIDVASKGIRLRKIGEHDEVLGDRIILDGVSPSSEAEIKIVPAAGGAAVTWRGQRNGRLVRQLVVTHADLAPIGEPVEVAASSCATRDALYYTDGKKVHARRWRIADPLAFDLPKDKEAGLVCGAHRAFALLEEDESTSLLPFPLLSAEAGTSVGSPTTLLRDKDFGEDEQRERAEYTVDDDFGVVRFGNSGAFAMREMRAGVLQPLRRLKTTIPHDDEVVAVDASPRALVIVYTQEGTEGCPGGQEGAVATKVRALRVDRASFEESLVDLAPGTCGREVGPFFTSAQGENVAVAWVERTSAVGRPRAPISALAHAHVPVTGAPTPLARVDEAAEALVDAGCEGARCFAVALTRDSDAGAGMVKVLRY